METLNKCVNFGIKILSRFETLRVFDSLCMSVYRWRIVWDRRTNNIVRENKFCATIKRLKNTQFNCECIITWRSGLATKRLTYVGSILTGGKAA